MGYINVDPITKKVKEYKNQAEWIADVEKATARPEPKQNKNMTFPEASKKLREEYGIDLRSPAERQQAEIDGLIERKVAEGVSAALARQQAMQSSRPRQEVHSSPLDRANAALARIHETQKELGLITPKACGCHAKHSQKAEQVIHSAYAVGPVMEMPRVSWPEAQRRLRDAGVTI